MRRLGKTHLKSVQAWQRSHRQILTDGKGAWAIIAKKPHKQELASQGHQQLKARRAAHRAGDMRQWLTHLIGPPQPLFPAAIEAPPADSPAAKASAGAEILQHKYGVRRWDADRDSRIIRCSTDDAGRRRGSLLAPHEVPEELRATAEAAWNYGAEPIDFGDPTRALGAKEREYIRSAFAGAPGESQFKLCVMPHLGPEAQEATVSLIEAMLRSGLVPLWHKRALLLWTPKLSGGLRGLSLLEELLKSVEVIVTRRLEKSIRAHPLGRVLSESNVGYQKGRSATLVLDVMADFYDEAWQVPARELTLVPWDHVAFFDRIDTAVPDAVFKARGVPETTARLLVEIHSTNATLSALMPWGPSITRAVGAHQGGCSAPFLHAARARSQHGWWTITRPLRWLEASQSLKCRSPMMGTSLALSVKVACRLGSASNANRAGDSRQARRHRSSFVISMTMVALKKF